MTQLFLAWRLARRELRGGLSGFKVVIACLVLGVAGIAAVGSVGASLEEGLRRDGRMLLGGDVSLRLVQRPPSAEERAYLTANAAALSDTMEMRAMAHGGDDRRILVQLKAVDDAYPLVGALSLTGTQDRLQDVLANTNGVWGAALEPTVLNRLDLAVGDRFRIGEADFQVRAVIAKEPDRVTSVINFGPRVMIADTAMPDTELVQPGSQIRYYTRVLVPGGSSPTAWIEDLDSALPEAGWRIRQPGNAAPGVERFVERMTLFLSFAALSAMLVGGIGVGNGVSAFLERKTGAIATLKCVGASGRLIFLVYFQQVMVLAAIGIGLGLMVGTAIPAIAFTALEGALPVSAVPGIYPVPLTIAGLIGFLTATTFSIWPLLRARTVPASALFRSRVVEPKGVDRLSLITLAVLVAVTAGFVILTASDRGFAVWFVVCTAVSMITLRLAAGAVRRVTPRLTGFGDAAWRLGIANLHRAGNRTDSITMSLGLGLAVLVAIALVQGNLSRQISDRLPDRAPAFFFLDIQSHQVAEFDAAVGGIDGVGKVQRVPSLRGRIVEINGVPSEKVDVAPNARWALRGDRALTYRAETPEKADFVAGQWWAADYSGPPLISLDANVAKGFGVGVGDTLTLNILGRDVTAEIASLRAINWRSLQFDFAIIFSPGVLEGAPHVHVAAADAPVEIEDSLEKAVTDKFSNVTAVRVREALEAAANILAGIGLAVRGAASVALLAGVLVLSGAIIAGHRRRVYDSVVFKVLGATRRNVARAYLVEYGALGLATGLTAAVVGTLVSFGIVAFLMDMEWVFLPGVVASVVGISLLVVILAGLLGTWRALSQPAAPLLRNE
ncbi:MAG: ABC transporter permease [Magnetospiraceae bacterium]